MIPEVFLLRDGAIERLGGESSVSLNQGVLPMLLLHAVSPQYVTLALFEFAAEQILQKTGMMKASASVRQNLTNAVHESVRLLPS